MNNLRDKLINEARRLNSDVMEDYWRTWATASDGSCLLGKGMTPSQAADDALEKLEAYENFVSLCPEDKLRTIMEKESILSKDMELCIRLLTQLALEKRTW